jgi:hypothetical protein
MITHNKSRKSCKTSLKITIFSILLLSIFTQDNAVPVNADYVVIDWGDVAKLKVVNNYRLPGEEAVLLFNGYVNLYLGDPLPSDLNATYDRLKIMFPAFRERVIGMRIGSIREFTLSYIDAGITNNSDPTYGADLIFEVEFLEMLFDVEVDIIFELTPTHPVTLLLLAIALVFLYTAYREDLFRKGYHKLEGIFKGRCEQCGTGTSLRCASPTCRKPLCRSCFIVENKCPYCNGTSLINISRK